MQSRRLLAPILIVGVIVTVACTYMIALTYYGGDEPSKHAIFLYNVVFSLAIVCGVEADRKGRVDIGCYEYNAFLFFLWPFVLPVYLFRTRRWPGIVIALGVIVLSETPSLAGAITDVWLAASSA